MDERLLLQLDEREGKLGKVLAQQESILQRAILESFDQMRHDLNLKAVQRLHPEPAPGSLSEEPNVLSQLNGTWQPHALGDDHIAMSPVPSLPSEHYLSESMVVTFPPGVDSPGSVSTGQVSAQADAASRNLSNVFRNVTDLTTAPEYDQNYISGRWIRFLDYIAAAFVVLNSIALILELELEGRAAHIDMMSSGPRSTDQLRPYWRAVDGTFDAVFLFELLCRVAVERGSFRHSFANLYDCLLGMFAAIDLFVVLLQEADRSNLGTVPRNVLRAISSLRALRLLRVLRLCNGLQVLLKACQSFASSLCWSMVLLLIFIIVGALVIGNILQDFIQDQSANLDDRQWVWHHYGTAYRSWLTLYEVTFAGSWPTRTRPVLDKVSQGFAIFFVLYITVIAFALIRIITAIFLKDTLDAANNDAELQIMENMTRREKFVRHLQGIFRAIDDTGDGMITQERLEKVLSNPKVRAYFQTLDLDITESTALFHLLDDGDGEVTLHEFISGILRCKGHARAIDQVALHTDIKMLDKKVSRLGEALLSRSGRRSDVASARHRRDSHAELLCMFSTKSTSKELTL
ncbi:Scn11a [Symbiodinium sp. CCMP2456]|nr:Scn11a [Symbiodinium sp. CCMP2456]